MLQLKYPARMLWKRLLREYIGVLNLAVYEKVNYAPLHLFVVVFSNLVKCFNIIIGRLGQNFFF